MKLICKCGNIEDFKQSSGNSNFTLRNCDDGTMAVICKKCNEIVFINIKNG